MTDLTTDDPLAGRLEEVEPGMYRWHCATCPGHSLGLYDGIAAAWDALRRHHEAIRHEVHR